MSLQQHVGSWPPGAALALDTEFVRERTYYPRLCLIQAATGGQHRPDRRARDCGRRRTLARAHGSRPPEDPACRAPGHRGAPAAHGHAARAGLRHAAGGGPPRLPRADRLRGARPATPRRRARQGPRTHGLVAPPAVAGTTRLRGRRCPLPSGDRGGARGSASRRQAGVPGSTKSRRRFAISRSIAWSLRRPGGA